MTPPLQWVRDQSFGTDPTLAWAQANTTVTAGVYVSTGWVRAEGCTIAATGLPRTIEAGGGIVRGCDLTGESDGIAFRAGVAARPSLVEACRITGPGHQIEDRHHDGIQLWTGGHLTIARCVISGWPNSAVFIKTDVGPIDKVTIGQCVLSCEWYFPIYVRDGGHGRPTNVTVTGCVFDGYNGYAPISTGDDLQQRHLDLETRFVRTEAERTDPTWVVWSGNTRPDGSEIAPPGGWHS